MCYSSDQVQKKKEKAKPAFVYKGYHGLEFTFYMPQNVTS